MATERDTTKQGIKCGEHRTTKQFEAWKTSGALEHPGQRRVGIRKCDGGCPDGVDLGYRGRSRIRRRRSGLNVCAGGDGHCSPSLLIRTIHMGTDDSKLSLALWLASFWRRGAGICWRSLQKVGEIDDPPSSYAVWPLLGAILVRGIMSTIKFRVGRRIRSSSLLADAWNDSVDILSAAAALVAA